VVERQVVPHLRLGPDFTDAEVFDLAVFEEPLVPLEGVKESPEERTAFAAAVGAFQTSVEAERGDLEILEGFLAQFPESRWRPALEMNLGLWRYGRGYFSRAISHYENVFRLARDDDSPRVKALADRALAERALMAARLGRVDEADALRQEAVGRKPAGRAAQMVELLRFPVGTMQAAEPGEAFKCGPYALVSVRLAQKLEPAVPEAIAEAKSGREGFSLRRVMELARQTGMPAEAVAISPEGLATLPLPAVVHWKLDHYAAIVERSADGTRFLVRDRTFGFDGWVSAAALAEEASGHFLVFAPVPGARGLAASEAEAVVGRGFPDGFQPNQTSMFDLQSKSGIGGCPMAEYSVHLSMVSLNIADTPVQYEHLLGPSPNVKLFYNELATIQPANSADLTTFGNQWSHNWNSWIKINSLTAITATRADVILRGGGVEIVSMTSGTAGGSFKTLTKVVYTGTATDTFRRELPNGWQERYDRVRTTGSEKYYYLTAVRDEKGNEVTVSYQSPNRIDKLTDENGKVTDFQYTGTGGNYPNAIVDPFGRTTSFTYTIVNGARQLTKITDPAGIESSFAYTTGDRITSLTTSPYGTTTFVRDPGTVAFTRWIEATTPPDATNPNGRTERIEYTHSATISDPVAERPPSNPIAVPNHSSINFGLDVTHLTNAQNTYHWTHKMWRAVQDLRVQTGNPNLVDYSKARIYHWLRTSVSDPGLSLSEAVSSVLHSYREPLEYREWYNYEGQSNYNRVGTKSTPKYVLRRTDTGGTELRQYEYNNAYGQITKFIDPLGRETKYTYEANEIDLDKIEVLASGTNVYEKVLEVDWTSSSSHNARWIEDANGQRTSFTWEGKGRVNRITNPLGEETVFTYSGAKLVSIDPAFSGTTDKIVFTYDSAQRVLTRTSWSFTGTYAYDNLDRLTSITYPDATTETWNYQISGTGAQSLDVWRSTDRLGRTTSYEYDSIRRLKSSTDPLNRTTAYEWCYCGALQKLTDAKNQVTDWKYDIQGRLVEKKIDGNVVNTYTYDPARGLLASGTDALGQAKVYTYALDRRLTNLDYQYEVEATPDVTWQWDQRYPRQTTMIDGTGTTSYGYGAIGTAAANLLETENLPGANDTIQYAYDLIGRPYKRQIDGANNSIEFARDALGRVTGYNATSGTMAYNYSTTTNGRLSSVVLPNGQTLNIGYLGADPSKPANLRKLVANSGTTTVARLDYPAINAMGRIGQITASVSTSWTGTMEYDAADQLTRANTTGTGTADNRYAYDAAANLSEWQETISGSSTYYPYTKDATNFTTEIDRGVVSGTGSPYLTFTRDANGNTTGWSDAVSGKSETLTWDAENRLIKVAQSPANKEFVMVYDGRNRLHSIEEKLSGVTQKTTRLIWSEMEICEERDVSTGTVLTKYFPDGEVQWVGGSYVPVWYYRDHLGSILETYSSAGTRQSQRRFDEWGRMTGSASGPGVSKKGYTGHYQPDGMDYVMAPYRWYSPTMRGWLSRDPIGENGGINLYEYVSSNPINRVDPLGLLSITDCPPTLDDLPWPMAVPPGADVDKNILEANRRFLSNPLASPGWFYNQVRNNGPWDYKQAGSQYQDFGNFNYGAAGAAAGFDERTLLREAGRAQQKAGTSKPEWGYPGWRVILWGGGGNFGDDPHDAEMIKKGFEYYHKNY